MKFLIKFGPRLLNYYSLLYLESGLRLLDISKMGEMYDQIDLKELKIDGILANCEFESLKDLLSKVLVGGDFAEITTSLGLMSKFREKMGSLASKEDKGGFLFSMIPHASKEIATKISDVLIKGECLTEIQETKDEVKKDTTKYNIQS